MQQKNLIIAGVVILAVVLVGYFMVSNQTSQKAQIEEEIVASDEAMMDSAMDGSMDEESMEEHKMMMDDGQTVMAMSGEFSPATLYATPGQEVKIANHESYDLKIVAEDGSFESEVVVGGENGSFKAPTKVGKYNYYSSAKPEIKGVLVVEE